MVESVKNKVFLFLFISLSYCAGPNDKTETKKVVPKNERGTVSVSFDFGNETIDFEEIPWREGLNVYDILKQMDTFYDTFSVSDTIYGDLGHLILGFNDIKNEDSFYWVYCLNGIKANRGVNNQDLKNGDQISWYFTKGETPCSQKVK